jgi:hypothetical protein
LYPDASLPLRPQRLLAVCGRHMVLTDHQIERYSRQIIVPGVGGRAQERLLASCVAMVAESADAAGALAYLAGAGVGRIVMHPVGDRTSYDAMVGRMRDLNPDVSVDIADDVKDDATLGRCDLMLALFDGVRAAEAAARIWRAPHEGAPGAREHRSRAAIIARLDASGRIALLPAPPPCPLCAEMDLLSPPPGAPAANAGALAMVAVTEAFKLLAGVAGPPPAAERIEVDGDGSRPRTLDRRHIGGGGKTRCVCEALS